MEQLFEFYNNHLVLMIAFTVIAILLVQNLLAEVKSGNNLDPTAAIAMINHQDALMIDVRPAADFSKGHIINALSIPLTSLSNQLSKLEKHRNKPIVVSCRSGMQSKAACAQLRKQGFEQVFNLKGGFIAWQNANFPTSKKK